MKESVFQAWWRVAVWMVPIIIFFTWLFNRPRSGGLGVSGVYADTFSYLILGILYAIFIVTSLVRIILAYRKSR